MTLITIGFFYLSLLLLLAVISAAETAIGMSRELSSKVLAAQSPSVRQELQSISANPFPHLHRALLLSAMLNLALAASALFLAAGPLREMGWQPWASAASLFGIAVLIGDVIPKLFAARSPSSILLATTKLLKPARLLLDPPLAVVERASEQIVRLVVPKRVKMRQPITQEELETLIEVREEQGVLDEAEAAIIREILDMAQLTVRDCMIPRVSLAMLPIADAKAEGPDAVEKAETRFVLVHGDTPDAVHGVIDSHAWKLAGRPDVVSHIRPPVFVPETLSTLDAVEKHLGDFSRCVLVVDEYGGLEGMLSLDEIADWLLSDAAPWQGEEAEIRDLGDGRLLLDGGTRLDDIERELGVEIAAEGIDTIGGFIFTQLGHVPKPGERISIRGADIKVRRVSRARVQQVEMRLRQNEDAEAKKGPS